MPPSLVRPTVNRAVHLRITPRPSNLGESREIMRLISQFGEVEYFKNLKYDTLSAPDAALVIFKTEQVAEYWLKRSPIRFRMGRTTAKERADGEEEVVPTQPVEQSPNERLWSQTHRSNPFGNNTEQTRSLSTARSLPNPPPRQYPMPFLDPPSPSPLPPGSQIFQIQANPSRANFRNLVDRSHFYGSFQVDGKSLAQQDLAKSVPILGLSDLNWRAEGKPWRVLDRAKQMEHEGPGRRKTLREVYEEGLNDALDPQPFPAD